MDEKVQKALQIWHEHFDDPSHHYSEFEPSDIEYFVGCMLYNHFAFSKAHPNLKTMDLSYDFLQECGERYEEVAKLIKEIVFESEEEALAFLQNFVKESKAKYTKAECYLLDRMEYHLREMAKRYRTGSDVKPVDFTRMKPIR